MTQTKSRAPVILVLLTIAALVAISQGWISIPDIDGDDFDHHRTILADEEFEFDGADYSDAIPYEVLEELRRGLIKIDGHESVNCSGIKGCGTPIRIVDRIDSDYLLVIHGVDDPARFPKRCGHGIPLAHYNVAIHRRKEIQHNQTRQGDSYKVVLNLHIATARLTDSKLVVYESGTKVCFEASTIREFESGLLELTEQMRLRAPEEIDLYKILFEGLVKFLPKAASAGGRS